MTSPKTSSATSIPRLEDYREKYTLLLICPNHNFFLHNKKSRTNFIKPVIAYIAGRAAPKERRMGHAGAIVYGNFGSAESKVANYAGANVPVAKRPAEVPELLAKKLRK